MSIPKTSVRGLKSIRTNVARIDRIVKPHNVYLRIGSLEMERERKLTEMKSVTAKLEELKRRCSEIDAEKLHLLRTIGEVPASLVEELPDSKKGFVGSTFTTTTGQRPQREAKSAPQANQIKETEEKLPHTPPPPRKRQVNKGMTLNSGAGSAGEGSFKLRY